MNAQCTERCWSNHLNHSLSLCVCFSNWSLLCVYTNAIHRQPTQSATTFVCCRDASGDFPQRWKWNQTAPIKCTVQTVTLSFSLWLSQTERQTDLAQAAQHSSASLKRVLPVAIAAIANHHLLSRSLSPSPEQRCVAWLASQQLSD